MRPVETNPGRQTAQTMLARALDFVGQIRETPIVVSESRDLYVSRVFGLFVHEGLRMLVALVTGGGGALGRNMALTLAQVARECARQLIQENAPGTIVNIASVLALRGQKGVSAYMASKAGLVHLTRSLALEWARHSIRVNALLPGYVRSELTDAFLASEEGARVVRNIPQRRLADASELSGPLLLLASSASSYMTGSVLVADGGLVVTSL